MSSRNKFAKILDSFLVMKCKFFSLRFDIQSIFRSLCIYGIRQLFKRFSVIEEQSDVNTHFRAENVLSEAADVTGIVTYNLSRLWTEGTISLQTLLEFLASQLVWTVVTLLTEGSIFSQCHTPLACVLLDQVKSHHHFDNQNCFSAVLREDCNLPC